MAPRPRSLHNDNSTPREGRHITRPPELAVAEIEALLSSARRGELAERQQRLGAILVTLKKMAEEARNTPQALSHGGTAASAHHVPTALP